MTWAQRWFWLRHVLHFSMSYYYDGPLAFVVHCDACRRGYVDYPYGGGPGSQAEGERP